MYFSRFAPGIDPIDQTESEEFQSLLLSAAEIGTPVPQLPVSYLSRNVVVNGIRIHILQWGDPSLPQVVLLHGGNHSAHTWDLVSLALADRYHVIAVDQRGHGDSEWPRDHDMTITAMMRDDADVFDLLGLDRPVVVAHSMSGRVAMALLVEQDRARKFALVDIGPDVSGGVQAARGAGERSEREGQPRDIRQIREFASIDEYVANVAAIDPSRSRESILRTMPYNMLQRVDGALVPKTAERLPSNMAPGSNPKAAVTYEDLRSIRCHVLVVRGEQSPMLAGEIGERVASSFANATLVTVPKCGHNVHTQNTNGFLDVLLPFLAS